MLGLRRVSPIRDAGGQVAQLAWFGLDITERKRAAEEVRRLSEIVEQSPASIMLLDVHGTIKYTNQAFLDGIGYARGEIGDNIIDYVSTVKGISMDQLNEIIATLLAGKVWRGEYQFARKDGSARWASAVVSPIKDADGHVIESVWFSFDATEQRQAADEVRKLSMAIEQNPCGVMIVDVGGHIAYANPRFMEITGYTAAEVIGQHQKSLTARRAPKSQIILMHNVLAEGREWHGEYEYVKKDGSTCWVSAHFSPIRSDNGNVTHIVDIEEDITERKRAEEHLKASLREKEVLIKEIHHRVKNNLQVVSSILSLQANRIGNLEAQQALEDSKHRVRSIALVHEKIYGSDDLAVIDFKGYVENLATYLQHSYSASNAGVDLTVEGDAVKLGANVAVPCGLALNELISNCFKHAFKDGRPGHIRVSLAGGERVTLVVEDDGVGLPAGFDPREAGSMGMQIVNTLIEQIEGDIALDRSRGTKFTITFSPNQ